MKFIAKNTNLRIVLRHGMPAEPITGRNAVPGLHVKFEDGVANCNDQNTIDLMLRHNGFERDFVVAEEGQLDPYLAQRKSAEPEHDMIQLKYGHVEKNLNPKSPTKMTTDQKAMLKKMAIEIAKELAPGMAKKMLKDALIEKAGEKKIKPMEESPAVISNKSVDCVCGFKAKNTAGLKAHQRFCKEFKK